MILMAENPLHQLTIGQRHVLRVLFECRWNYAEAAMRLRVAEPAVRSMVHRAVRRARVDALEDLAYWLGREDERTA